MGIHNKSMCLPAVLPEIPSTECHFILLLHYFFQSSFLLYQQRHHPAHSHHSKHAAAQRSINLKHSIFHKLHCFPWGLYFPRKDSANCSNSRHQLVNTTIFKLACTVLQYRYKMCKNKDVFFKAVSW